MERGRPRPEVEVEVDERIEAALFTDAERQGVSPTELAGHAVLVYLAELDLIGDPDPVGPRRDPLVRRALPPPSRAPRTSPTRPSSPYFHRLSEANGKFRIGSTRC